MIKRLPADDKKIRKLHCKQVLRKPLKELDAQPLGPLGKAHKPLAEFADLAESAVEAFQEKRALALSGEKKTRPEKPEKAARPAKAKRAEKPAKAEKPVKATKSKSMRKTESKPQETDAEVIKTKASPAERSAPAAPTTKTAKPAVPDAWSRKKSETAELPASLAEDIEPYEDTIIEQVEESPVFDRANDGELEFTEEELAAFDTNLTDENGEIISKSLPPDLVAERDAPPIDTFFDDAPNSKAGSRRTGSLDPEDPVIDAPSIGRKTAKRLNRVGIFTVQDLLDADEEEIAGMLNVRHITSETLLEWQAQTQLMVEVPGLRVHDAQILTGAGVRSAEDLSEASAREIFRSAMNFLTTEQGSRISRDDHVLHEEEVVEWIDLARDARVA